MPAQQLESLAEGASHYKEGGIEPIELILANELGYCEGNIVKYAVRHGKRNGADDIRKLIHYARILLEHQYGVKSRVRYQDADEWFILQRCYSGKTEDWKQAGVSWMFLERAVQHAIALSMKADPYEQIRVVTNNGAVIRRFQPGARQVEP